MAVCWLPAIYLLTYSVFAARALFHECDTRRIWIEEYDDPEFTCMVDITATVRWFLTSTTGSTRDLGTCEMPYNCTSTYSSSELSLTRNGTESLAKFYSLHRKFDGELLCQETLSNGTLVSDTCPLKVGRATFRQTHYSDLLEDRGSNMFCYCYDYAPSTISWTLITHSGQTLDLGNCTDVNVCTSLQAPNVTLERLAIYPSFASFDNTDRSLGGQVRCSYTYNGSTDTDELLLNLYYPARLSNCHAEVSQHNWSTVLVCDINNVLSSSGAYDFTVFEKFQILKDTELTPANRFIFEGRLPYGNILEPYTDSAKNKVYYRGRLFYSWPLSPVQGLYTRLELYVYFGHSANRREYIPYNFNVTTPNNPTHNCSELTFIPETGEVPCVCTALSLGSPAGRLLWLLGNLTIATGGYGVNQLKFPSGLVNRQHDGMMMRCQLDWVLPKSTAPIRHVAYGPESLTLQINQSVDATNNTEVHVISHVTGMKPMMSEMVLWGGVCQGHQGFTCTLTPRSAAEVDGKAVTCRVTNTANNGLSAEASAIVRLSREFNGADMHVRSVNGYTALHLAISGHTAALDRFRKPREEELQLRVSLACLLISNGALVDAEDFSGRGPLSDGHPAIREGVETFIRENAQLVRRQDEGTCTSGAQGGAAPNGAPYSTGKGRGQLTDDLKGAGLPCGLCGAPKSDVMLLPCQHKCVCNACGAIAVTLCPLCKVEVTSRIFDLKDGNKLILEP